MASDTLQLKVCYLLVKFDTYLPSVGLFRLKGPNKIANKLHKFPESQWDATNELEFPNDWCCSTTLKLVFSVNFLYLLLNFFLLVLTP